MHTSPPPSALHYLTLDREFSNDATVPLPCVVGCNSLSVLDRLRVAPKITHPVSGAVKWPPAAASDVIELARFSAAQSPRYLLRGRARGPLVSGPGMTVSPLSAMTWGVVFTGPERCRRRR